MKDLKNDIMCILFIILFGIGGSIPIIALECFDNTIKLFPFIFIIILGIITMTFFFYFLITRKICKKFFIRNIEFLLFIAFVLLTLMATFWLIINTFIGFPISNDALHATQPYILPSPNNFSPMSLKMFYSFALIGLVPFQISLKYLKYKLDKKNVE